MRPGLSSAWKAGATLYRALGRIDASRGVRNWREALTFLTEHGGDAKIGEVQFWGHGTFGKAWVGKDVLDVARLSSSELGPLLDRLRSRLAQGASEVKSDAGESPDGRRPQRAHEPLVWFRTCETMGGPSGHAFARALVGRLDCRVAGHTHAIGVLQSGLVSLRVGEAPRWPLAMGVDPRGEGFPGLPSSPAEPSTVHFLTGRLPQSLD